MAELLLWLSRRFDPRADIPSAIGDESERVAFVKAAARILRARARVPLDNAALYRADSDCVTELLRVARRLPTGAPIAPPFELPPTFEAERVGELARDLGERGPRIEALLAKEATAAPKRNSALSALQNALRAYKDNPNEFESKVRALAAARAAERRAIDAQIAALEREIARGGAELDRLERKLDEGKRPSFAEEQQSLERELDELFKVYSQCARNIDQLEESRALSAESAAQSELAAIERLCRGERVARDRAESALKRANISARITERAEESESDF